jgi:predicted dehydrogenase
MAGKRMSRRNFVNDVAQAGLAFTIVPRHVLGGRGFVAPSDKLNIASIGCGGKGWSDIQGVSAENIYALCDVDWHSAQDAFTAYPQAKKFRDFREMLDREGKNIDAVTVSTPDHVHAAATMAALRMDKPVFCQKPLARTLGEVRAVAAEAGRRRLPTQMGNQGHTFEGMRQIREWVEAGVIGTVREVNYWTNRPIWPQGIDRPLEAFNTPPWIDWNLWLGPAPERPYAPNYAPFNWRGWWDFGTGALGDMACHGMDAAFWGLDLRYPTKIEAETTEHHEESPPKSSRVTYWFPERNGRPEVKVIWRDGGLWPPRPAALESAVSWPPEDIGGQMWIGDSGALLAGMYGENPRLVDPVKDKELKASPPAQVYPRSPGVYAEWINAIKGGPMPNSNFAGYSGPLTEMVLLGCLAVRTGTTLTVNPSTGEITSPTIPAEWMRPHYRDGWSL